MTLEAKGRVVEVNFNENTLLIKVDNLDVVSKGRVVVLSIEEYNTLINKLMLDCKERS